VKQHKTASLKGVERDYQIEDNLDKLGAFYKIGLRYVTLT
jgi:microsomal dipeptidase-like Zn-dependent dipeptidase